VQYAGVCSRHANGCTGAPSECFSDNEVVTQCTRAAATCGVGDLGESAEPAKKEAPHAAPEEPHAAPKAPDTPKEDKKAPSTDAPHGHDHAAAEDNKPKITPEEPHKETPAPKAEEKPEVHAKVAPVEKKAPSTFADMSSDDLSLLQVELEQEIPQLIANEYKLH